MKKRLLIIQNQILHYRKPVYNELAKHYIVTVLHSGSRATNNCDQFSELIVPCRRFGPFHLQAGVRRELYRHDVILAMCDVRWLANVFAVFSHSPARFLYWGHRYSKQEPVNLLRNCLLRRADGVVQYNEAEHERMIASGIPIENMYVAINTLEIPNHADTSALPKNSFLFVGRAQKRKKVDVLLNAFAATLGRLPDDTLVDIVGDGPENSVLKDLTASLNIADRVCFHGEITDARKLKRLFERAIAYVSPGPVGLGAIHSLAYGVPIVTSETGKHGPEFQALSDGKNAIVYADDAELPATLVRLCSEQERVSSLGRNAYQTYRSKFTVDQMIRGFVAAIDGDQSKSSRKAA